VKEYSKKDKIGSKPDKNRNRGEAGKSQKQLQWIEEEKLKKMQKEGPEMQRHSSFTRRKKKEGLKLQFCERSSGRTNAATFLKLCTPRTIHAITICNIRG
nr:hypothetical protein [Tanacetum cinerariifolium]